MAKYDIAVVGPGYAGLSAAALPTSFLPDGKWAMGSFPPARRADAEYGYIHPCSAFATSDMVIEVSGEFF